GCERIQYALILGALDLTVARGVQTSLAGGEDDVSRSRDGWRERFRLGDIAADDLCRESPRGFCGVAREHTDWESLGHELRSDQPPGSARPADHQDRTFSRHASELASTLVPGPRHESEGESPPSTV